MAEPFFKLKDTGEFLSDKVIDWSFWNMPWGKIERTPVSGGSYLQATMAGTLRLQVTLAFATRYPNATLDNFFRIFELERDDPQTLYRFRSLEGFTQDVQIAKSPFGDSVTDTIDLKRFWHPLADHLAVPFDLVVPGYLPVELG